MTTELAGALIGGGAVLVASPYLARLTLSAPDKDDRRWWTGRPATPQRTVVTAVVGVLLGVAGGWIAGVTTVLPPFVVLALVGAPLIVIDYEHHRLPNRLVFVLALGAPLLALLPAASDDRWPDYGRAAAGAAAVFVVLFALAFLVPKGFGYGDVKLGGILGGFLGWYGWTQVYYGIFGGFVLGALASIVLLATGRATRKTAIPFGPALIAGPLVVLVFDLVPAGF